MVYETKARFVALQVGDDGGAAARLQSGGAGVVILQRPQPLAALEERAGIAEQDETLRVFRFRPSTPSPPHRRG